MRVKPLEYLFFDWVTFLVLSVVFIIGVVLLYPHKLNLSIPEPSTQVYILESVLRNISLFIGISFSFMLLSFNIFFKYFGRYAVLDFFKMKSARIVLTLLICTIVLLTYSTAYIRNLLYNTIYNEFLYVFCITLSVVSLFSVFPCLLSLLKNSHSRENIKRLFKKLNKNWIYDEFETVVINKSPQKFYHKDPISILNEIGVSAIKDFDTKTISVISSTCISFFQENLQLTEEKKTKIDNLTLYDEFTQLLLYLFKLSVKERNENASMIINNARFKIEEIVLNNFSKKGFENFIDQKGCYSFFRLNCETSIFFKRAIQFNEDEVCKTIIAKYSDFGTKAIPKIFPKDFHYNEDKYYISAHQADVIFVPLRAINELVPIITNSKKLFLFEDVFKLYSLIELTIAQLKTADKGKDFILNYFFNYKYDVFSQYIELPEVQHLNDKSFPFKSSVQIFEDTGSKVPFLSFLKVMNLLFVKSKLNNVVIHNLRMEMLHLLRLLGKKPDAKALIQNSIIRLIEITDKITQSDSDYKKDIYVKLKENLKAVFDSAIGFWNINDQELIDAFKNSLSSLENQSLLFAEELKNKNYFSDNRIF